MAAGFPPAANIPEILGAKFGSAGQMWGPGPSVYYKTTYNYYTSLAIGLKRQGSCKPMSWGKKLVWVPRGHLALRCLMKKSQILEVGMRSLGQTVPAILYVI